MVTGMVVEIIMEMFTEASDRHHRGDERSRCSSDASGEICRVVSIRFEHSSDGGESYENLHEIEPKPSTHRRS
jgi:hypothetical protein